MDNPGRLIVGLSNDEKQRLDRLVHDSTLPNVIKLSLIARRDGGRTWTFDASEFLEMLERSRLQNSAPSPKKLSIDFRRACVVWFEQYDGREPRLHPNGNTYDETVQSLLSEARSYPECSEFRKLILNLFVGPTTPRLRSSISTEFKKLKEFNGLFDGLHVGQIVGADYLRPNPRWGPPTGFEDVHQGLVDLISGNDIEWQGH